MRTVTAVVRLHRKQAAFCRSPALYRAFVGGRGAGKSWVGAYDLIRRAKAGRTYLIASPTGVILQDTTWPTFKRIALDLGRWDPGAVRVSPYPTVTLTTGATVRFRTAQDPERMRGPNLSGCWLDEASLMPLEAYQIAIASLREGGEQGWLSATFTPKGQQHWTYQTFGTARPDTALFHARTGENPFNPAGFEETLRRQYPEALAAQELAGEFVDVSGEAAQVIPTAWARLAVGRWAPRPPQGERLSALGVDVARGGADKTVIAPRHGAWIGPLQKYPGSATPDGPAVVLLVGLALRENPQALVNVDVIGVGSSVYDGCAARGWRTLGVNFAQGVDATDQTGAFRLANLRALAYWGLREALDPNGPVRLALPPDDELQAELTAPRWKMQARGLFVEPKEDIARPDRLGRSPDCADAVALACLLPRVADGGAGVVEVRV